MESNTNMSAMDGVERVIVGGNDDVFGLLHKKRKESTDEIQKRLHTRHCGMENQRRIVLPYNIKSYSETERSTIHSGFHHCNAIYIIITVFRILEDADG